MLYLGLPGPTELYVVIAVIVLMFGAKKIPDLARSMGSGINQFKKGLNDNGDDDPALGEGQSNRALSEEKSGREDS